MKLRCVKGNIGLDGVRYAVGDVFDVGDDSVADALIGGKWAVVDGVAMIKTEPDVVTEPDTAQDVPDETDADVATEPTVVEKEPDDDDAVKEPEKPKRGRPKK